MSQLFKNKKLRAGFTLVELLAVMAIVMILAAVIIAIQPGNPEGLSSAQRISMGVFRTARYQAMQAQNPDRNPETNPLYNIRSRVLVLNDSTNEDQHLRMIRVIIGGTRNVNSSEPSDYYWYTVAADEMLPKNVYFISPDEGSLGTNRKSRVNNKDASGTTMRFNYEASLVGQAEGSGDTEWYFYEFNQDGTSNMNMATFMVSEGDWDPSLKKPIFRNKNNVTGFAIVPSGAIVPYNDPDEMDKGNT
ncbi:MAG: prepilin-type N-terminal cleavage/methylation domain-containing protein [Puniceicoccales bacterium]|jgi:prepilin-type N-terminal cleavage/methylation domain-containing protein|nr:prepilin-type N-terminal cleavage/methylation domain-containing protein [Puniceicoccales bacterium]